MAHGGHRDMQECIDHCTNCHRICVETAQHCLGMGGQHAAPEHIRLLLDCAQICATSADFMLRGSPLHVKTCAVCSEICRLCADACARMAGSDELMKRCADLCRQCAESCMKMAGAAV
jgi:hypothetical protein